MNLAVHQNKKIGFEEQVWGFFLGHKWSELEDVFNLSMVFAILHIICRGKRHRASLLVRLVCTCVHSIMVKLEKSKNKLQEDANARGRWTCTGNWGYLVTTCTLRVHLKCSMLALSVSNFCEMCSIQILKQLGLPADVPAIHKNSKTNFTREVTFHRDSWHYLL